MASIFGGQFRLLLGSFKIVCATHFFLTNVFQVSPVQGPSMLPTFLVDGDWIAADTTARLGRGVKVGDVVLYKIPLFADQSGAKRVLALPGDYVSIGTPDEPGEEQMIQLPAGHCWVVGDNLPASRDSRHFGPLPLALIQGKVVAKILPWENRAWLESPFQPPSDEPQS